MTGPAQLGPYLDSITDETPPGVYHVYASAPNGVKFEATITTTSAGYFAVAWRGGTWCDSDALEGIVVCVGVPLVAIFETSECVITGPVVWIVTQP